MYGFEWWALFKIRVTRLVWKKLRGNFCLWNRKSWASESAIQLWESGIRLRIGIFAEVGSNCLPNGRCLSSVFWSLGDANVLRPEGSISSYPYHIRYPTPFPRLFLVLNISLKEFLSLISRVNPERKSYDTWYLSILTKVESKLIGIGLVLGFYTLRLRFGP